jgi:ankyrin repeat protein
MRLSTRTDRARRSGESIDTRTDLTRRSGESIATRTDLTRRSGESRNPGWSLRLRRPSAPAPWLLPVAAALFLAGCRFEVPVTPLGKAAVADDAAGIRKLLAEGQDPNALDSFGWAPLIWAARTGRLEAIRALLDGHANPDLQDQYINGWTAMMHAVHRGQEKTVRALLAAGADPNTRARHHGTTALMLASCEHNEAIVRMLLDAGADPGAKTEDGTTALFDAVASGEAANATLLLERDPQLRLPPGLVTRGVLFLARLRGQENLARRVAPIE